MDSGRAPADVVDVLNRARVAMFQRRLQRPQPDRDDKILTAWNGLMIAALARTSRVLGAASADGRAAAEPYLRAARRAAAFLRERMWNADRRQLLRRYRGGDADIEAYAEDYACLIFGLIDLFQADADPIWLEWAITLQHRQDELFWDEEGGGWFSTTGQDPSVLVRMKEDYDGAEPSASSIAVMNLLVLSQLVDDPTWTGRIDRTLRAFGERLEQLGRGVPMMAAALSTWLAGVQQIVIVEGVDAFGGEAALARAVGLRYLPFAIQLRLTSDRRRRLRSSLPFVAAMDPVNGKPAVYVCRDRMCLAPAMTVQELEGALA